MESRDIRVMVRGGLGNQLFGWSAGLELARRSNANLIVNFERVHRGDYALLDPRGYELGFLGVDSEANGHLVNNLIATIRQRRKLWKHPRGCVVFRERSLSFDPRFFDLEGPICVEGYFQSLKYFLPSAQVVRETINSSFGAVLFAGGVKPRWTSEPWVAVHVRRGDYTRIGVMELLGREYYRPALELLRADLGTPKVVVFSDEPAAARSLVPEADEVIGPDSLRDAKDVMFLMAQADGFVGANSTFSWWSAFISNRTAPRNIFPRRWFRGGAQTTEDLLVDEWTLLGRP